MSLILTQYSAFRVLPRNWKEIQFMQSYMPAYLCSVAYINPFFGNHMSNLENELFFALKI